MLALVAVCFLRILAWSKMKCYLGLRQTFQMASPPSNSFKTIHNNQRNSPLQAGTPQQRNIDIPARPQTRTLSRQPPCRKSSAGSISMSKPGWIDAGQGVRGGVMAVLKKSGTCFILYHRKILILLDFLLFNNATFTRVPDL